MHISSELMPASL